MMITNFVDFLDKNNIVYKFLNGYEIIFENTKSNSDFDILLKKQDFIKIDSIIKYFCKEFDYDMVQMYHQEMLAKNIFLYDKKTNEVLNLDLYGELSRKRVVILNEQEIFNLKVKFRGISILKPSQEFIQYLIKKIDKQNIDETAFNYLCSLYAKEPIDSNTLLKSFFSKTHPKIITVFNDEDFKLLLENLVIFKTEFKSLKQDSKKNKISNLIRVIKRVIRPTGTTICFLGPDGSGKSTIINGLLNQTLPFRRNDYFHLKPIVKDNSNTADAVTNPQEAPLYSKMISFVKLIYYFVLYNVGWFKNIFPLKIKSSLIIFDRYYDDILVDNRRFRYSNVFGLEKLVRFLIPRPKIYFILTTDADIIYKRKQEVTLEELKRQIFLYRQLADGKRYFNIDVNRTPKEIVEEITNILMNKMHERY